MLHWRPLVIAILATSVAAADSTNTPATGFVHPNLVSLDEMMAGLIGRHDLPGAQLSIAKDGRLVHDRAYGYADFDKKQVVRPDSLFRIASVSKVITQVAVLRLVDRGLLKLDDKAFEILNELKPPAGASPDPRLKKITIHQILRHEGGWDPGKSFEPMFLPWSRKAAQTVGAPEPASCETIIRFMLTVPLDFDPGSRSAYSNFGYCVLGRVVETVLFVKTGRRETYDSFVQREILKPAGIHDMRIAGTKLSERARREVRYYHQKNQTELPYLSDSVYPGEAQVPWAYGGYYLQATDSHGGWLGTAEDIVKFATAIDGQRGRALLLPESVNVLMNLPKKTPAAGEAFHVAHAGALQGCCSALLYRRKDGIAVGFTANSLPVRYQAFIEKLLEEFDRALDAVSPEQWPQIDRFR
jgi:N-acyl-D-amino-acid deacylase